MTQEKTSEAMSELLAEKLEEILGQNYVDEYSGAESYISVDEIASKLTESLTPILEAEKKALLNSCDAVPDDQPNDVHIKYFNQGYREGQAHLLDAITNDTDYLKARKEEKKALLDEVEAGLPEPKRLPRQGNFTRKAWQKYDTDSGFNLALTQVKDFIKRLKEK